MRIAGRIRLDKGLGAFAVAPEFHRLEDASVPQGSRIASGEGSFAFMAHEVDEFADEHIDPSSFGALQQ
jgi:hypothetical protein